MLVALANMTNLTRLVWTASIAHCSVLTRQRDRSISAELFNLITSLPSLRALEISGHSTHAYDPTALGAMPHLEDLRVMMPDATFKSALGDVLAALSSRPTGGLRSLALVCKSTNLINDTTLRAVAHDLTHLRHLTLIGVPRISKEGVYPLLQSARIEELVLDASPYSVNTLSFFLKNTDNFLGFSRPLRRARRTTAHILALVPCPAAHRAARRRHAALARAGSHCAGTHVVESVCGGTQAAAAARIIFLCALGAAHPGGFRETDPPRSPQSTYRQQCAAGNSRCPSGTTGAVYFYHEPRSSLRARAPRLAAAHPSRQRCRTTEPRILDTNRGEYASLRADRYHEPRVRGAEAVRGRVCRRRPCPLGEGVYAWVLLGVAAVVGQL